MDKYILAIDQGTTSTRALIFDKSGIAVSSGQHELTQHFPADGWVEHDAIEIWETTLKSCYTAIKQTNISFKDIACIGITNQRETTVVWDRQTGEPIYRAIVWQDRRTSDYCEELNSQGNLETIQKKTGLLIDPYFSASKLRWLLDNVPNARKLAEQGSLAFGTIDCYLLWRLTGGKSHYTDATNASRTMLFNIRQQRWDPELLKLFNIPAAILPEVKDCAADFGVSDAALFGCPIPITGIIGDQQAAALGQGCFNAGMAKSTYGTGCFLLMNTGNEILRSSNRLLSTVAYRLSGKVSYAIEGSIFMAGATMQWIRDGLKLIEHAADSEAIAEASSDDLSVYLVPAFTGLGAPYWDPHARAALFGMTRDTQAKELVTAALMSVCYQTKDLVNAIISDGAALQTLRVDGGMANNNYMLQKLADLLNCEVHRPLITETTALGAAYVAGLQIGLFEDLDKIGVEWKLDQAFSPTKDNKWRESQYAGWLDAVSRTRVS